ncbi:MAG: hypothetical protein CSA62_02130 [Planctomycetota bacterium]|nr:MAG: hypothetical protein CSA62_02130 [Planctomycetota bacterium]
MLDSKEELLRIRDSLWTPEGREQLGEQVAEARLRLRWVFGELLSESMSEERIRQQIVACFREMGPRGLDPQEWAERFVAYGWLSAPKEHALWRRLESFLES